jgi:DNA repair exonuclease SbcCD ATPase subunit
MKSETLSKITQLLASLQKRITKTAQKAQATDDRLDSLIESYNEVVKNVCFVDGQTVEGVKKSLEDFRVQAFQRSEAIAASLAKVKAENDDREARQAMRDQSNVQSLVNLRDSTAKAFDQVKKDVQELINRVERANSRINQVENQNLILNGMPVGHEWVNKKLSGVYETCDDFETRVRKLEELLKLYENLRKAQNDFAIANGAFLAGPAANDTPPSVWSKVGQGK